MKSISKICLIIVCLMICLFPILQKTAFAEVETAKYIVTANNVSVFESADFYSTKKSTLNHKTEVLVEIFDGEAKKYQNGNDVFFHVFFDEQNGYVFADLLVKEQDVIEQIPNFNGQTNTSCKVFLKNDENFVESEITLEKKQRLFLYEGYQKDEKYTAVCFVYGNEVVYGYIETKNISPDGINPVIIYCVIVIMAVLGIIFAWLFMKNKKVKIKKK